MENREQRPIDNGVKTSAAAVAFAWLLVGIPLAWGVFQTFTKSLALFQLLSLTRNTRRRQN